MTRCHSMSVAALVALLLVATTSIGTEQSQKAPGRAGPAGRGSTDILSSLAKGQLSEIGDTAEDRIDLGGVFFGFIDVGCSLHDTKKSLDPKRLTDYFMEKDPSTMLLGISVFKLNRMYQPTLLAIEGNGGCDSAVVQRMMSNLADLFNERMSASRPPVPSDEPRRRSMIADAVQTPVAAWCGAGYKAADIASVPADPGPPETKGCIWDILRGWAQTLGLPLVVNTHDVDNFYEAVWKRELSSRIRCEQELNIGRTPRDLKIYNEQQDQILNCSAADSQLARLKKEFKERQATTKTKKEAETADKASKRAEACNQRDHIRDQQIANANELQAAKTKMSQEYSAYGQALAREKHTPQERKLLLDAKREKLMESFGVNRLQAQKTKLIEQRLQADRICMTGQ